MSDTSFSFAQQHSLFPELAGTVAIAGTKSPLSLDAGLKLNTHSSAPVLDQAIHDVGLALQRFATDPNQKATIEIAFGEGVNLEAANDLLQGWAVYDFSNVPKLGIRLGSEINNADGAFASDNETIYLSSDLLTQNAGNPDQIAAVLLEEVGHFIDFRINQYDAPGDEGDIFSRLVRGEAISAADLLSLKTENDHALVTLDGRSVAIEMSQIQMTEVGGRLYQIHRGTDNNSMYLASSHNGKDWNNWEKIPGETLNAPAITNYKGTLYVAHWGLDDRIYFASASEAKAGKWKALSDGGAKTPDAVAMVEYRGKLYMAHRGQDNGMYLASWDGANWSGWRKLEGQTPDAIAMAVSQGKLYIARRDMGNQIFIASLEGDSDASADASGKPGNRTSSMHSPSQTSMANCTQCIVA
ncbi:MAG: hypothetical protein HC878_15335 [Leptolyngbyaceae cyanobacterium SL_5_14]|nr:hypothetical protein [Leptolyngbyaceae cyanobacterium SL_5_14]